MHVHHTKIKLALELGCYLSVVADNQYRIFWPQQGIELFGSSPDDLIMEMHRLQDKVHNGSTETKVSPVPPDENHIAGIPKHGGIAYAEGVPAADCPYPEESDDFSRWNDQWDEAADREEEEATQVKLNGAGSVVTNRYRARYAELGHPTNCGDELAILLNNVCQNKAGTNLEIFEAICKANGVSLTKYNRSAKGWQGRLRMTGRNLLAKQLIKNGGKLIMPAGWSPESYQLDGAWIYQASIKYKPRGE